jgi:hypothetical protein
MGIYNCVIISLQGKYIYKVSFIKGYKLETNEKITVSVFRVRNINALNENDLNRHRLSLSLIKISFV